MIYEKNVKYIIGAVAGSVVAASIFLSNPIKAATGDPTGSCGAIMDIAYKNVQPTSGASYGANVLMLVNFDNLTINARANVTTHPAGDWKSSTISNSIGPVTFALTSGPFANSYVITPAASAGIPTFAVLSVNSGNTFLLQAQNDRGTGVCQKI